MQYFGGLLALAEMIQPYLWCWSVWDVG